MSCSVPMVFNENAWHLITNISSSIIYYRIASINHNIPFVRTGYIRPNLTIIDDEAVC